MCEHGTCAINPALTEYMGNQVAELGALVDYGSEITIRTDNWTPFPVNDTIGYGVILGLLWKLTGTYKFFHVQLLQIILFALLMPLAFACARILFGSAQIAWWCVVAQLFFFPLLAMNMQPVRDIWAYYGVLLLLYGLLSYIFENKSRYVLLACAIGFSICQWARPAVLPAFVLVCGVLAAYGLYAQKYRKRVFFACATFVMTTMFCFWFPFMTYNKINYDRYFVGPVGQDLLEGMGEFENPWGFQLSDQFVNEYISKKYGSVYGTPQFDDDAKKEFMFAYQQKPAMFYTNIFRRVPQLLLPGLPWIYYENSPYGEHLNWREKLKKIFGDWRLFFDFLVRHVYIRLFLLLGYLGIIAAVIQKRYFAVALLLIGIMVGGWGKLPSHIEYRYLVPFYWVFAWFVGYALCSVFLDKTEDTIPIE